MYMKTDSKGGVDNILLWWERATPEQRSDGLTWYQRNSDLLLDIAHETEHSFRSVVGAVAAVSPMVNWDSVIARLPGWICYEESIPGFKRNIDKARLILETNDVSLVKGPKCTAFFINLLQPTNPWPVTIDRHAAGVWANGDKTERKLTPSLLRRIAEDYRTAGDELHILPNQVQAVTWVAFKSQA